MSVRHPVYNQGGSCQDCYKCVRQCPVKAIRVEKTITDVVGDMCIGCGRCIQACSKFFKKPRKDIELVENIFKQKKKVYVSLDPSFVSEFAECSIEQIIMALKHLGFFDVSETALGADVVSAETAKILKNAHEKKDNKLFISSACPSVVKYLKLYKKEFARYIIGTASPLLFHARMLRKLYGDDIGVVSISSCIAKKFEADSFEEIDAAITFSELRQWFLFENITPEMITPEPCSFIPHRAANGVLFSLPSGTIKAAKYYADFPDIISLSSSGIQNIDELLSRFNADDLTKPVFLSLNACSGGCINGPGMCNTGSGVMRRIKLYEYSALADTALDSTQFNMGINLNGVLDFPSVPQIQHSKDDLRRALASVGKFSKADEINCQGCGYDTCRDFAAAMLEKHAERTMCVSNMRHLSQRQANGLLRAIPSGVVIVDKELNIIECNEKFARLMGDDVAEMFEAKPGLAGAKLNKITNASNYFTEFIASGNSHHQEYEIRENKKIFHLTIFSIEKNQSAAGVLDDITTPQIQKDRTIEHAKSIIDKNVSVVQQIAFLLGEHAAETEAILHSMMQSYSMDD